MDSTPAPRVPRWLYGWALIAALGIGSLALLQRGGGSWAERLALLKRKGGELISAALVKVRSQPRAEVAPLPGPGSAPLAAPAAAPLVPAVAQPPVAPSPAIAPTGAGASASPAPPECTASAAAAAAASPAACTASVPSCPDPGTQAAPRREPASGPAPEIAERSERAPRAEALPASVTQPVRPLYLGLEVVPINVLTAAAYDTPPGIAGLVLARVADPAASAGLRPGDVLVSVNGIPTLDARTYAQGVRRGGPASGSVEVLRGRQLLHVTVGLPAEVPSGSIPADPSGEER